VEPSCVNFIKLTRNHQDNLATKISKGSKGEEMAVNITAVNCAESKSKKLTFQIQILIDFSLNIDSTYS
jgi:hypothetical protein